MRRTITSFSGMQFSAVRTEGEIPDKAERTSPVKTGRILPLKTGRRLPVKSGRKLPFLYQESQVKRVRKKRVNRRRPYMMKFQIWIPLPEFLLRRDGRRRLRLRRRSKPLISGQQSAASSSNDDEVLSKSTTGQTEPDSLDCQPLRAKRVSLETVEQAAEADPLMGREPLPSAFLLSVAERLREASGFDGAPDLSCARTIAKCFRGKGKLVLADWLWSATERHLGAKTKAQGPFRYGLFMRDAEASVAAGMFPLSEHVQSELRLREAAEARDRTKLAQQQEAELTCFMATPLPVDEAVKVLRAERNVRDNQDLTPAFIRFIRAERHTISPGELATTAAGWQPCVKCRAGGLTGHDLDGTLAYCDLPGWAAEPSRARRRLARGARHSGPADRSRAESTRGGPRGTYTRTETQGRRPPTAQGRGVGKRGGSPESAGQAGFIRSQHYMQMRSRNPPVRRPRSGRMHLPQSKAHVPGHSGCSEMLERVVMNKPRYPVSEDLAMSLTVEHWSCLRGFSSMLPAGRSQLARILQQVMVSADQARAVAKIFDELCPTPREIRETAERLGDSFEHKPAPEEEWRRQGLTADPVFSAQFARQDG
jgi:hypothetical protein